MYRVTTSPLGSAHTGYHVYGPDGYVDTLRTQSGADHAARMLNSGCCVVDEQRPVGRRITPNPAPQTPQYDVLSRVWDEQSRACPGHPADEFSPMGETVYCDGSCVADERNTVERLSYGTVGSL